MGSPLTRRRAYVGLTLARTWGIWANGVRGERGLWGGGETGWPLHDIAITNMVLCMTNKWGVGGGAYIAQ